MISLFPERLKTWLIKKPAKAQKQVKVLSLYTSINELPLYIFIECSVTGNLRGLVQSGFATEEQLMDAWENIIAQYRLAMKDNEYKQYLSQYKQLARMEIDYDSVIYLISFLRTIYDKSLADNLNQLLGTSFVFDPFDHDLYLKNLERSLTRANGLGLRLEIKELEVQSLYDKQSVGSKPNVGYYQSVLITLSDQAKYQITDRITVYEFCERVVRFNSYSAALEERNNSGSKPRFK